MPATISTTPEGVAINGYDPVAYFTAGEATRGRPEHTREWGDVTWRFESSENADRFADDPGRYAPQVGGHCAFGNSLGKAADASPTSWRIIDGKLYLMQGPAVRALSRLFTGRIIRSAEDWPAS